MSVAPQAAIRTPAENAFYKSLADLGLKGLWDMTGPPALTPEPRSRLVPAHWRYNDVRTALQTAGELVTDGALAERRALQLINPAAGPALATVSTLITAYQMILPEERAASHRHTPNALRLVIDAPPNVYTVVDGVRYDMTPNDVVLTPNWCWHGHANDSAAPAIWIDYLDAPLVRALEPMFFEPGGGKFQTPTETAEDSPFLYRWRDVKVRLDDAKPETNGHFSRQVALDQHRFPSMSLSMCALDSSRRTQELRTTANNVYSVVAGRGHSVIGKEKFAWERGDVFVAPTWQAHYHEPDGDAVVFRVTDEPLFAALGWLR